MSKKVNKPKAESETFVEPNTAAPVIIEETVTDPSRSLSATTSTLEEVETVSTQENNEPVTAITGPVLKFVNKSNNPTPEYKSAGASGMDICANLVRSFRRLFPGERALIPTGIFPEVPVGYEIQVRPRSGIALNYGVTVLNTPGTIDSDYRGEIGIILINHSRHEFMIKHGDRIAQLVVAKYERPSIQIVNEVEELSETERGANGFGHTGV